MALTAYEIVAHRGTDGVVIALLIDYLARLAAETPAKELNSDAKVINTPP